MAESFFMADTHFGHKGMTTFLKEDGTKVRPWDTTEEHDTALIENINKKVPPSAKIYLLGDAVINRRCLPTLHRINCKNIVLVKGNHDGFKLEEYTSIFSDIRAYHLMDGMIFSHIPIHPDCLGRFGVNVHGHLHDHRIMILDNNINKIDVRYHNVSMEQIDFTPVSFDELKVRIVNEGGSIPQKTKGNQ